jgi:hypothetical protein
MGDVMEGAMQQAPQPERQFMPPKSRGGQGTQALRSGRVDHAARKRRAFLAKGNCLGVAATITA